jgi:RNA polymerase sigma factor (sigma-70 family)
MERAQWERLVADHQNLVFSVAMTVLRDRHGAEDVAQEVFMKAFDALDRLRDPGRIKAWLAAMARNRAIDHVRARERRDQLAQRKGAELDPSETPSTQSLETLLQSLKEEYRQIILLRYVQKLSYKEISDVLGLSVGAVGELLHRIRKLVLKNYKESADAV